MADQVFWNESDAAFVRRQVAPPDVTDQEFRLFIHLANTWKLDPLAREIYITKYGSGDRAKAQIFVGLAGLLKIANRGGKLDGCEATCARIEEPISVEYKDWGKSPLSPFTSPFQYVARAVVYKRGAAHPFIAEVREDEYSTGQNLWRGKRQTMLKKVAMCQALRLAFALSGLYDEDEFGDRAPAIEAAPPRKQLSAAPPAEAVIEGEAREVVPVAAKPARPAVPKAEAREWDQTPRIGKADQDTIRTAVTALDWAPTDCVRYLAAYHVDRFGALTAADGATVAADLTAQAAAVQLPAMANAESGEAP